MCCMAGCRTGHGWCDIFTEAASTLPASGPLAADARQATPLPWYCRSRLLTDRLYVLQAALHAKSTAEAAHWWPVAILWLRL